MTEEPLTNDSALKQYEELLERVDYDFGLNRRAFVQILGAGLLIAASAPTLAQRRRGFAGGGARTIAARIHLGKDGSISVLTGKVEAGQGARAELTQAAAEELRVPAERVQLIMADTSLVPDDGITAGSGSSPRTVPAVRQGATAARQLLIDFASRKWAVEANTCEVRDGKAIHAKTQRTFSYAELANEEEALKSFEQAVPSDVSLTAVQEWKVLGTPVPRPNRRDIVTGTHKYPSDISRPGMFYGKVLRAPSYGAKLTAMDLAQSKKVLRQTYHVAYAQHAPLEPRAAVAEWAEGKLTVWTGTQNPFGYRSELA